jgi:O-antigen biosynthesis protein
MKYKERVKIFTAGADWSPQDYGLENAIVNLGVLPYEKTASLYRTCDLGIVFMFTKHPSYLPFELMASGCPVLTNKNPSNNWFLKENENCLISEPSITCVFEKIEKLINDENLSKLLILNGLSSVSKNNWEDEMEKIYNYILHGRKAQNESYLKKP